MINDNDILSYSPTKHDMLFIEKWYVFSAYSANFSLKEPGQN